MAIRYQQFEPMKPVDRTSSLVDATYKQYKMDADSKNTANDARNKFLGAVQGAGKAQWSAAGSPMKGIKDFKGGWDKGMAGSPATPAVPPANIAAPGSIPAGSIPATAALPAGSTVAPSVLSPAAMGGISGAAAPSAATGLSGALGSGVGAGLGTPAAMGALTAGGTGTAAGAAAAGAGTGAALGTTTAAGTAAGAAGTAATAGGVGAATTGGIAATNIWNPIGWTALAALAAYGLSEAW